MEHADAIAPRARCSASCRDDPEAGALATTLLAAAGGSSATLEIELDDWMHEVRRALEPLRTEVIDRGLILAE